VPTEEVTGPVVLLAAIFIAQNAGGIRVINNVLAKEEFVLKPVPDEPAKQDDGGTGADGNPDVCERARARETWIDVDDGRAAFFRFHHPTKTDWMSLGHRGAFDQNAIRIGQILLRGRSSAPAERGAQTGHRAAMSYPRLIRNADHSKAESEQLSNEIILFVIEGRTSEVTNCRGVINRHVV